MSTLLEIAERTKVSKTTVSRVLNAGSSPVPISTTTREKVLAAAKELNYQPNLAARSLRTRQSNTIGVVVSAISDPYYFEIIGEIDKVLNANDYHFFLCSAGYNPEKEEYYLSSFRQRKVDGILDVGGISEADSESILSFARESIPVVFIGRETPVKGISCVLADDYKGGFLATEHLIKLRHKRIGYLTGPPGKTAWVNRLRGYRAALESHSMEYEESLVIPGGNETQDGYDAVTRVLKESHVPPTAIFTYNDMVGFAAIRAVEDSGLSVPKDIAVVGFDDIQMAAHYNPPLTTVRQPMGQMGRQATSLLLDLIKNGKSKDTSEKIVLDPKLVIRKSCGYNSKGEP